LAIRGDLDSAAGAVGRIESARVQLDSIRKTVADATVKQAAEALEQQFVELEMNFVDLRLTGEGQDNVRFASKLIEKLGYLSSEIAGSDYRPTDQQEEVRQLLHGELHTHLVALDSLVATQLTAFNEVLRQRNVPAVIVGTRAATGR
jgi:hypothetical protein